MAAKTNGNLAYKYQEQAYYNRKNKKSINKRNMPAGEKVFYIFSVIFVVIVSSFVISGYAQIAEYNYSIQKLENSITQLNKDNESLQREIAKLSSPERIITIAKEELGMTLDEEQVIVLSKSTN